MPIEGATTYCKRCRQAIDADAVQCDYCGEVQLTDRSSAHQPGIGKQIFTNSRQAPASEWLQAQRSQGLRTVPVRSIAIRTAIGAVACGSIAGICFGLAWLVSSLTLPLMNAATWGIIAGAGVVFIGCITIAGWKLLNIAEGLALRYESGRARAREEKRIKSEAKAQASAAQQQARAGDHYRRFTTEHTLLPTPWTLSFAILGIICGGISLLFSMIPVLGYFTFIPMLPAGIFAVVALVLSFYERSQKLFPVIALVLTLVAAITMGFQMMYWEAVENEWERELQRQELADKQERRQQAEEIRKDLEDSMDTIFNMLPRPPSRR